MEAEKAIKALYRKAAAGRVEVSWLDSGTFFVRVYPSRSRVNEMVQAKLAALEADGATSVGLADVTKLTTEAQDTAIMVGQGATIAEAAANVEPR